MLKLPLREIAAGTDERSVGKNAITCLCKLGHLSPVTGRGGSYTCETSRLPHFLEKNRLRDGGEVISLTSQKLFTTRKIPGTHFCYRLNQPHGQNVAGNISDDLIENRIHGISTYSIDASINYGTSCP
jgi:hypothetical protein